MCLLIGLGTNDHVELVRRATYSNLHGSLPFMTQHGFFEGGGFMSSSLDNKVEYFFGFENTILATSNNS